MEGKFKEWAKWNKELELEKTFNLVWGIIKLNLPMKNPKFGIGIMGNKIIKKAPKPIYFYKLPQYTIPPIFFLNCKTIRIIEVIMQF